MMVLKSLDLHPHTLVWKMKEAPKEEWLVLMFHDDNIKTGTTLIKPAMSGAPLYSVLDSTLRYGKI